MSLADERQEIAEILSSIPDVTGFVHRPKGFNAGNAWSLIEFLDDAAGMNLVTTWRIIVVLPKDEFDAMEWFDSKYEAISDALNEQFGYVTRIEPGNLATEAGTRNVMILTVRKEA